MSEEETEEKKGRERAKDVISGKPSPESEIFLTALENMGWVILRREKAIWVAEETKEDKRYKNYIVDSYFLNSFFKGFKSHLNDNGWVVVRKGWEIERE